MRNCPNRPLPERWAGEWFVPDFGAFDPNDFLVTPTLAMTPTRGPAATITDVSSGATRVELDGTSFRGTTGTSSAHRAEVKIPFDEALPGLNRQSRLLIQARVEYVAHGGELSRLGVTLYNDLVTSFVFGQDFYYSAGFQARWGSDTSIANDPLGAEITFMELEFNYNIEEGYARFGAWPGHWPEPDAQAWLAKGPMISDHTGSTGSPVYLFDPATDHLRMGALGSTDPGAVDGRVHGLWLRRYEP